MNHQDLEKLLGAAPRQITPDGFAHRSTIDKVIQVGGSPTALVLDSCYQHAGDEKWVGVENYEEFYLISSWGRLLSLPRRVRNHRSGSTRRIQPRLMNTGKGTYPRANLYSPSNVKFINIHILVARTFLPNPNHKPQVNHKDGDKRHCCIFNLEWATRQEDADHAVANGLTPKGSTNSQAKLTEVEVLVILQRLAKGHSQQSIAQDYKVNTDTIGKIHRGETWNHLTIDQRRS